MIIYVNITSSEESCAAFLVQQWLNERVDMLLCGLFCCELPVELEDAQALAHPAQLRHVLGDGLDRLLLLGQEVALCVK